MNLLKYFKKIQKEKYEYGIKFSEKNVTKSLPVNLIMAENQEDYKNLPMNYSYKTGQIAFACELSKSAIKRIKKNKKIYISLLTFKNPMQPILIDTCEKTFEENHEINENWLLQEMKENKGE